ncbi:hypothetical protein V502_02868 [Pseudogymnoascus sp. VKM F-4520 (FW-2644)]|nr:hypothetical protein V502_02868 [Pseudogymnoascus sp. VKM F-4520 (FW-2644)]
MAPEPETSISDLPDEVLDQVLYHLSPEQTALNVRRASKRFARLSEEPLLWRYYCRTEFTYWDAKHQIKQKLGGDVSDVEWEKLYIYRKHIDTRTSELLDSILSEQIGRIDKTKDISEFGYDAKDILLRNCQAETNTDDVLARRFYSSSVLDHIHRANALDEWRRLSRGDDIPIERALGCFDMFVLHDRNGDLCEISDMLDKLAKKLKAAHVDFHDLSQRRKALVIARFLIDNDLTGMASELQYRDLKNNFIGIALQDEKHPSLPLISAAIFCAIARRLGLDAGCCDFPNHVHAVVSPNNGETLDGPIQKASLGPPEPMYLDPYRSDREVPVEHLRTQLLAWGVQKDDFPRFLSHMSTRRIALRTSKSILTTIHEFRGLGRNEATNTGHASIKLYGNPYLDMDNAFYSALWSNFILSSIPGRAASIDQVEFIPIILERFEYLYHMDGVFLEKYICASPSILVRTDLARLVEAIRVVRASDTMPKQVRRRDRHASHGKIQYEVGQVFRHKRYGYEAVITGWDVECTMNSRWMEQNNIDELRKGQHQSFYHALVDDTSIRYVAEENVEVIEPDNPSSLMSLAGRFFKRWDGSRHRFVSNIRDEYPDD